VPDKGLIVHHILCACEIRDRSRQRRKGTDDPVRPECRHRHVRIAEIDSDDGDAGGAGGADISRGIADHDGALRIAAGARDRLPENLRIGLLHAERILAADRGKPAAKVQRVQEAL
jgi:hypothetical protein